MSRPAGEQGGSGQLNVHIVGSTISDSAVPIGPGARAEVWRTTERPDLTELRLTREQRDELVAALGSLIQALSETPRPREGQDFDTLEAELSAAREDASERSAVEPPRARHAVRAALDALAGVADLSQVASTVQGILGEL